MNNLSCLSSCKIIFYQVKEKNIIIIIFKFSKLSNIWIKSNGKMIILDYFILSSRMNELIPLICDEFKFHL